MPDPTSTAADRSSWVEHYISEFSRLAKQHCPKADIEVFATCVEDEDAHIVVYVPNDFGEAEMDGLSEMLTKRSTKVLLETGILILAGVYHCFEKPNTG